MDLDSLLAEAAFVPDPSSAVLLVNREVFERALVPAASVTARKAVRRRRARRAALTALVATAASLALVLSPTLPWDGAPRDSAGAGPVLLRAAAAAGAQNGDWQDAPYWHAVSHYLDPSPVGRREATREIWIRHDGTGVLVDPGLQIGVLALTDPHGFAMGQASVTWDGLWQLPTDPGELERRLRAGVQGAGPHEDSELFTIVGDLLRESPAPPALRRALWQVAARIPGLALVGAVTDHAGRSGIAVEETSTGRRYVLDPDDGRLLEESIPKGWLSTYLEEGPAWTAPRATVRPTREKP